MVINSFFGGINMELSKVIKQYLESIGGVQCKVCGEWDDSDTFVGPICSDCNKEIEEVIAEAETYDKYDDPFYIPE